MFNCKINTDIDALNELNKKYGWIPGGNNVRPSPVTLEQKIKDMDNIELFYASKRDYLLENIFQLNTEINADGKCFVKSIPVDFNQYDSQLLENKYPYEVPENTKHFILWYPLFSRHKRITDKVITSDITRHIITTHGENRNTHPQFVWYINPKMTCPELFHVQVFAQKK